MFSICRVQLSVHNRMGTCFTWRKNDSIVYLSERYPTEHHIPTQIAHPTLGRLKVGRMQYIFLQFRIIGGRCSHAKCIRAVRHLGQGKTSADLAPLALVEILFQATRSQWHDYRREHSETQAELNYGARIVGKEAVEVCGPHMWSLKVLMMGEGW